MEFKMILEELKSVFNDNQKILNFIHNKNYSNLYFSLVDEFERSKAISNEEVMEKLRLKDIEAIHSFKRDVNLLYDKAEKNIRIQKVCKQYIYYFENEFVNER